MKSLVPSRLQGFLETLVDSLPPLEAKLRRAIPSKTLPVSVSGASCKMNCSHCGGHYLEGMTPLKSLSPALLKGRKSVLVSGGSDSSGIVPVGAHVPDIRLLAPDLRVNLHVGLQNAAPLMHLKSPQVTISFDLIGDDETIREVFGLDRMVADYQDAYLDLCRHFAVIPHITLGLRGGRISGEARAIDFLAHHPPRALTFLVFRPTPGTRYADCSPPPIEEVIGLIAKAARDLACPIHLGCMRPSGTYRSELDPLAWLAGARTIVSPDRRFVAGLEKAGVPIEQIDECCSLDLA